MNLSGVALHKTTINFREEPKTFRQKIASYIIPHYELSCGIESIKDKIRRDSAYALNSRDLSILKQAFISSHSAFGGKLLTSLSKLPPNKIFDVLMTFMNEEEGKVNVYETIDSFLEILDTGSLKKMAGLDDRKVQETIQVQAFLKNEALKSVLQVKGKAILKEFGVEVYYFIHHLIETFIYFTGLAEVKGHSKKNKYSSGEMSAFEAKSKFESYLILLGYPSLIFASSFGLLGSAGAAGLATAMIVTATLIMIPVYMRYLRPCPRQYEGIDNLNEKIMEKESAPIFKRRDVLMRIQNAFLAGKGVLLTANPGIGKTTVVDSLADLIVSGRCEDFLKNSQVFSANAGKLALNTMDGLNFDGLDRTFKKYADEVVFFFDEIESIFQKNLLAGKVSELFLTFQDKFRYIICATTTEQYEKTIKDKEPAFNRRFVHIEIKPLEIDELTVALYDILHFKAPQLPVNEDVIPYIIGNASRYNPKTSQVDAATSLLSNAIVKATVLTGGEAEKEMNAISLELDSLQKNLLHKDSSSQYTEEIRKYRQLTENLKVKKKELEKQNRELAKIKTLEKACLTARNSAYKLASGAKRGNRIKTREWLKKQAYHKILTGFLEQKKTEIGLPIAITKELIDRILQEVM